MSCRYAPGDVAVIHPELLASQVDAFLISMGYTNTADDEFTIEHTLPGQWDLIVYRRVLTSCPVIDQSLPDHMPHTITLREVFTRYLDISAVPRRSFFALLRHFTSDELECEKIAEFLSSEGAVGTSQ